MLTFNLKKEWFDKIKSGEKTCEYRKFDYWYTRIYRKYDKALAENKKLLIRFTLGYSKSGDKNRELFVWVKAIRILSSGINTDLKIPKPVIEISFELVKQDIACKHFSGGKCLAYESSNLDCVDIKDCCYKRIEKEKANDNK